MIHKYIFKRNQTFYFRWRVFSELQAVLGLKEIRISLRTSSHLVAISRANLWFDFINHAKLMKSAYQFSEISKKDFIEVMKKKINQIQSDKNNLTDSAYSTELIRVTHASGIVFDIDYAGDADKELKAAQQLVQAEVNQKRSAGITLSNFFEMFLVYKAEVSLKLRQSYCLYINTLIEIMGDKDIGLIEQSDIKYALSEYQKLPKRNLVKYKNRTVTDLLATKIDPKDRLTIKSVREVKKLLQGIFAYAVEKKYVANSVMVGFKINSSTTKSEKNSTYAKFEDEEVLKILKNVRNQKQLSRKWICWLAAYTGARRGEIVQLRKQDVKMDSKTKRRYLLITNDAGPVKTENASRKIPIHKALIDEGFLAYVESQEGLLFEGVNSETFTKWFAEFRESLGIERYDDYKQRKVFHSFRHTFVSKSRAAENPIDKVQRVVGHEKTNFGVTEKYSHEYDLYQLLDVVDKVSFLD